MLALQAVDIHSWNLSTSNYYFTMFHTGWIIWRHFSLCQVKLVSGNTNKSLRPSDRPSERIRARWLNFCFAFCKIVVKRYNKQFYPFYWGTPLGFHLGPLSSILVELEIGEVSFCGGKKKLKYPKENPWRKLRTNNKLKLHPYSTRLQPKPGHVGGRGALSSLCSLTPPTKFYQ